MYQDRIFAFTPKGELIQLPKGATPVDFAYAVHTDLGDRTVGAKVNGRVVPLRTMLENGDQVEILASEAQHPQPSWLRFVATGKARAGRAPLRPPQGARGDGRARPQDLRRDRRPPSRRARQGRAKARAEEAQDREPGRADDRDRAQARQRRGADGSADAGLSRRRRRPAPARPAQGDLDQGPDARRRLSSRATAAIRSPATASSASGARTRRSRSTSSAATRWRAGSMPTGSTSPGAKARTAARRGWR